MFVITGVRYKQTLAKNDRLGLNKLYVIIKKFSTCEVYCIYTSYAEMPEEGSLEAKLDTFYPKALDGFLVILSKEGDMIYVSETVAKLLGLQQVCFRHIVTVVSIVSVNGC